MCFFPLEIQHFILLDINSDYIDLGYSVLIIGMKPQKFLRTSQYANGGKNSIFGINSAQIGYNLNFTLSICISYSSHYYC